jgi:Acetoacetate decarboxylase (ADC)
VLEQAAAAHRRQDDEMNNGSTPNIRIMPTSFGVAGGPRQTPDHPDFRAGPISFTRHVVRFLGREEQIEALLPKGLALRGEPIVQFQFFCLTDIPWLAGRGYNLLSMLIPVRHVAAGGEAVDGQYQAVMWENLGDPIITGREQLGHPKLYAQLPPPRQWGGKTYLQASWEGFTFAELELVCDDVATDDARSEFMAGAGAGIISHKYIPKSGQWNEADADYLTLSPVPGESNKRSAARAFRPDWHRQHQVQRARMAGHADAVPHHQTARWPRTTPPGRRLYYRGQDVSRLSRPDNSGLILSEDSAMSIYSPPVIAGFAATIVGQFVALALIPATRGFTAVLPTIVCIVSFVLSIGISARLVHAGVDLSVLTPIITVSLQLLILVVAVAVYGESASFAKIGLLIGAAVMIGAATRL